MHDFVQVLLLEALVIVSNTTTGTNFKIIRQRGETLLFFIRDFMMVQMKLFLPLLYAVCLLMLW